MKIQTTISAVVLTAAALLCGSVVPAQANMKMMKAYKEVNPDAKVKCIDCHVAAMPKKDDGQHEMNDYGKAVIAEATKTDKAAEPTADTFKAVGPVENFKK